MVNTKRAVYLLLLSGELGEARRLAQSLYPGFHQVVLSKREFRESGWKSQLRALRKLRGEALIIFTQSLSALKEPQLLLCSGFLHGCRATVFADSEGESKIYTRLTLMGHLPKLLLSGILDALVLLASWLLVRIFCFITKPQAAATADAQLDVAYLHPYPLDRIAPGGATSHVTGFLSGLAENAVACEIFSGYRVPFEQFWRHETPNRRRHYLFSESQALAYNLRFVLSVKRQLAARRPRFLYQRHGRFVIAGALLSWILSIPLVLEYNGSEFWVTKHWDPARFRGLLRLFEKACLRTAFLIVVVSEPLRDELLQQGVPAERILVNPNAVDPKAFRPGCGGQEARTSFGFASDNVVVCFVGSFAYWHGIKILQRAITRLMERRNQSAVLPRLRFLLVGDGLLRAEIRQALQDYEQSGVVVFTGLLPHDVVPSLLDASDILVSPHVPMPDGRAFFGSPTKLFEYMAMGKAIVASDLDQLAQVLDHQKTAWLVPPGNDVELAAAIEMLAMEPDLRRRLGQCARESALERHTWRGNAARVLSHLTRPHRLNQGPPLTPVRKDLGRTH